MSVFLGEARGTREDGGILDPVDETWGSKVKRLPGSSGSRKSVVAVARRPLSVSAVPVGFADGPLPPEVCGDQTGFLPPPTGEAVGCVISSGARGGVRRYVYPPRSRLLTLTFPDNGCFSMLEEVITSSERCLNI